MAKTINEIAEKAWPQQANDDFEAMTFKASKRKAFCQGANAVLSEIENIITSNEDNTLCMARCLVDKIRELKGKTNGKDNR